MSDILEAGVGRHAVTNAELMLGTAVAATNRCWHAERYGVHASAGGGEGLRWEAHALRSDVHPRQQGVRRTNGTGEV